MSCNFRCSPRQQTATITSSDQPIPGTSAPATVADTSLAYFPEFLARESLRHSPGHPSTRPTSPRALTLVRPQPFRQVLKRYQHNQIIAPHQRRLAHPGTHRPTLAMLQLHNQIRQSRTAPVVAGGHYRCAIQAVPLAHHRRLNRAQESNPSDDKTAEPCVRQTGSSRGHYCSSIHSCSVKLSNVTNTTGSSCRIIADLLILARTVQPSQCCSCTTRFASASTPESAATSAGTVWKISGNADPANLSCG